MTERYSLGLDFGTESLRVVVVCIADGAVAGEAVVSFEHGVMDRVFPPTGEPLPPDFALQDPDDYLKAIRQAVPAAMARAGAAPRAVAGIGIDFTACTPLPVKRDGTPLAGLPEFGKEPHAMVKLWKHHGANAEAARINALAEKKVESFLGRYGGTTSSEWIFAKLLEIRCKAPAVYEAADRFMEASDWIVWKLTGEERRGACAAGYKGMWHDKDGYPSAGFLDALEPGFSGAIAKLGDEFIPAGRRAGCLTPEAAEDCGLIPGIPVSAAIIDAHAAVPGCGVADSGKMVIILGTSSCHMLMNEREVPVNGIQGVVRDGILPEFYGYEAGQAATGDLFAWFARNFLSSGDDAATEKALHRIQEKAAQQKPGENRLIALDWWNGNRSILINPELSGMILGMTLNTRPEDVFRALLEATGFGTRVIIDNFAAQNVPVNEVIVCGGIAEKNPLLLQIYADIIKRPIAKAASSQTCAQGAAIFGAVAAGSAEGGYDSVQDAVFRMAPDPSETYLPDPEASDRYEMLFEIYREVHDHFGTAKPDVMERLRRIA